MENNSIVFSLLSLTICPNELNGAWTTESNNVKTDLKIKVYKLYTLAASKFIHAETSTKSVDEKTVLAIF